MNRPCAKGIKASTCPGVDDPTLNFSSEAPDALLFSSIVYPGFDPYHPPLIPPDGGLYYVRDCAGVQYSANSQLEADLLALAAGKSCQNPDPDDPNSDKFSSAQQSFTAMCYDGTRFTYTVPVGWYTGPTQAGADAQALAMAQQMAALQKSCCNDIQAAICLNQAFYAVLATTSRFVVFYSASVQTGTLPPGMAITLSADRTQVILSGTPTTAGLYTFNILASNLGNGHVTKSYRLRVIGINPTTLPDAGVTEDYSYQLVAVGTLGTVTFSVDDMMIPDWLTVSSTGLISGTPTLADGDIEFEFDVTIRDEANVSCGQRVKIMVNTAPTPDVAVTSDNNPSVEGDAVTITATVTGDSGVATGSVTFSDGLAVLATVPLVAGSAQYTTSAFAVSTHVIKAEYNGDLVYNANYGTLIQTVNSEVPPPALPATVTVDAALVNALNANYGTAFTGLLPSPDPNWGWQETETVRGWVLYVYLGGYGQYTLTIGTDFGDADWLISNGSNTDPRGTYGYLNGPGFIGYPPGTITVT